LEGSGKRRRYETTDYTDWKRIKGCCERKRWREWKAAFLATKESQKKTNHKILTTDYTDLKG
jgi:hypothetical protein